MSIKQHQLVNSQINNLSSKVSVEYVPKHDLYKAFDDLMLVYTRGDWSEHTEEWLTRFSKDELETLAYIAETFWQNQRELYTRLKTQVVWETYKASAVVTDRLKFSLQRYAPRTGVIIDFNPQFNQL